MINIKPISFPSLALLLILFGASINVHAQLDLKTTSCMPGQTWAIPNQNEKTVSMWFNRGYLVINGMGQGDVGRQAVFDLKDITSKGVPAINPVSEGAHDWGHAQWMGVGEVISQNWSGHTQIDLSKLPEVVEVTNTPDAVYITEDKIWAGVGGDGHRMLYYPYSFKNVPPGYQWENRGTLEIYNETKHYKGGDPANPLNYTPGPLSTIVTTSVLGFEGRPAMIGNLVRICGDNEQPHGCAVYDIGDPSNPVLLDSIRDAGDLGALTKQYEAMPQWRNFIVLAMNNHNGFIDAIDFIDMADPTNLTHIARIYPEGSNLHRHVQFQDEFMYVGDKKYNMLPLENGEAPKVVQDFNDIETGEHLLPLGNLVVLGGLGEYERDDINVRVFCSQADPDTNPPYIGWHWPQENGIDNVDMHPSSRIGLVVNETLDLTTINDQAFKIVDVDEGTELPLWVSHSDHDYINITPREPLANDTKYQFSLVPGKLKDVSGNGAEPYSFYFSTGSGQKANVPPAIGSINVSNSVVKIGDKTTVQFEATDPEDQTVEYSISWGDGETTPWQTGSIASHSYNSAGIFDVSLKIQDQQGLKDSTQFSVMAYEDVMTPPASSSSIAMGQNRTVWNVNPDNDSVTVSDADSHAKIAEIPVGKDPRNIAMDRHGNMWVTNYDDGTLSIISATDYEVLSILELHPGAQPFAVLTDNSHIYVSGQASGSLFKIDYAQTSKRDYSALSFSNVTELKGLAHAYAMAKQGDTLLVTRLISTQSQAEVYRVDLENFTLKTTIALPGDPSEKERNNSGRGIPNVLTSISIRPDGTEAWISSKHDNIYRGLARDSIERAHDTTMRSIVSVIDLENDTYLVNNVLKIDNQGLASKVLFSPEGQLAYVLHQGNNAMSVFKTGNLKQRVSRVSFGQAPIGLVVDPKDNSVFIHSFLDRHIYGYTVFNGISNSLTAQFSPVGSPIKTVETESMSTAALEGKKIFYNAADPKMSFEGYISCAGCHLDGGSDERVWDFHQSGEGFRNTISLKGRGGLLHGRVHWTANFDEIQDFEHDIRSNTFKGFGFMDDTDYEISNEALSFNTKSGKSTELDYLAVYLATLNSFPYSPYRNADGSLNSTVDIYGDNTNIADGAKGKAIFTKLGCANCHSGDEFTDSPKGHRHDVGTIKPLSGGRIDGGALTGIDTPTLRGLQGSAPYLHNGSASTLSEVLNSAAHGGTDQLSPAERDDLIAYILQIDSQEPAAPESKHILEIENLNNFSAIPEKSIELSAKTNLPNVTKIQWYVDGKIIESDIDISDQEATLDFSDNEELLLTAVATYNNGLNKMTSAELIVRSNYKFN